GQRGAPYDAPLFAGLYLAGSLQPSPLGLPHCAGATERVLMLRGIRKASANWLGRAVMGGVMGLLALSFAVWGINDIFRGFGRSTLAKIGGTEIPIESFRQTYNERLQQISRRLGRPIP